MIILDTNVLSEFMKLRPHASVVAWLDRQDAGSVWTTSITVFEVEFGLQRMPAGKRRSEREGMFQDMIAAVLRGRVLPFDRPAAVAAGAISAALEAQGRPVEIRDVQIAGIARARNATVATRKVPHFDQACDVFNPFSDS
jgi:predicted nucleic acid-binding protein